MAGDNGHRLVQIVIVADPGTGTVQVQGPPDPRLWQWMLAEAHRVYCAQMAQGAASTPKPLIQVVRGDLPPT